MPEKKKKGFNFGSVLGGIIVLLAIAGGPILKLVGQLFGKAGVFPSSWLPLLIGGLVALSVLVSVVRALGQSMQRRNDTRLPTFAQPPLSTPNIPATRPAKSPAMGANASSLQVPSSAAPRSGGLPSVPRFDPIFPPMLILVGLAGLALLAGLAVVLLG